MLIFAHQMVETAALGSELIRRGAMLAVAKDVPALSEAIRSVAYDTVLIVSHPGAPEALLLIPLIRAQALGSPKILLLVDPDSATTFANSAVAADAMLASTLAPERIAEAAGVPDDSIVAYKLPVVVADQRQLVLCLPAPLPQDALPEGVRQQQERGATPDVIILTQPSGVNLITSWMGAAAAAVVPVIDASGRAAYRADATLSALTGRGLAETMRTLEPIVERVRELPEAYFRTTDARSMLTARLAVRERAMKPVRDANLRAMLRFADESVIAGAVPVAEGLVRTGHMTRSFFDRLHCCPSCHSSRLNVREECASCRSANVTEEPIIHHLRCGYQGPESDFKRPDSSMVCPKCSHVLEHFSVDYDKPGSLFVCGDCGHTTGDTAIGFVCMDCDSHHDAEKVRTRAFYSYELTESGREAAYLAPLELRGQAQGAEGASVRERIQSFAGRYRSGGRSHAVLMIRLDATGEAAAAAGERVWRDAVALYGSILRELFNPATEIVDLGQTWLVLIGDETREKVETALPDIRAELEKTIAVPLGARYDVLGADQLAALA